MPHKNGFTIVELLIVIVVIGILAAITIVAYSGITTRANNASLQSDASNSAKVLENDKTLSASGTYPASASAANGGKGLPTSKDNVVNYAPNNAASPPSYILTITKPGSNVSYRVTNTNPVPVLISGYFPIVTTHPQSYINYSVTFTSAATGSPTPTIQWQKSSDNSTWANISGATSTSYTTQPNESLPCVDTYFRAVFTNSVGVTYSNVATSQAPCGD